MTAMPAVPAMLAMLRLPIMPADCLRREWTHFVCLLSEQMRQMGAKTSPPCVSPQPQDNAEAASATSDPTVATEANADTASLSSVNLSIRTTAVLYRR